MIDNVRDLLIRHEGIKRSAYQDSLGYWTIGVGHLIDSRKGGTIPDDIIYMLLDRKIEEVVRELSARLSWYPGLDAVRRSVLTDMGFNLGVDGLLGFTNTLKAVEEGRWEDAANGMLQSKWAKQVGPRASRLSLMMKSGEWPTN